MKVQRTCMRDGVRDLVVERILDGTYPPGARIKELALASECKVSQAPVREALRELEVLGLVESERYRGTRVRAADLRQLREAYELRALLEERAAQLIVPCSAALLRSLEMHFDRMRRALRRLDYKEYAAAATSFHRAIVAATDNTTFMRAWDSLHWEVRTRVAGQKLRERGISFEPFVDVHEVILRALAAGDGMTAGRKLRELLEEVLNTISPAPPAGETTCMQRDR
jgi:DNA-binding GntR family transcriptional regulator